MTDLVSQNPELSLKAVWNLIEDKFEIFGDDLYT